MTNILSELLILLQLTLVWWYSIIRWIVLWKDWIVLLWSRPRSQKRVKSCSSGWYLLGCWTFCNCPHGLTFTWWGCRGFCFWHDKPTKLAHSFLFCSFVYFCLYGPFNCISFHKFSQQLSAFSLSSSGLISALLVLSTIYLFMKVSFSPDVILCGWLGLKHQLTN